jgi:sialic acid synthase SpsE
MVGWGHNPTTVSLGIRQVGDGAPCFVLAEVASRTRLRRQALKMLEAAFKMGADGIKFQLFRSEQPSSGAIRAARISTPSS